MKPRLHGLLMTCLLSLVSTALLPLSRALAAPIPQTQPALEKLLFAFGQYEKFHFEVYVMNADGSGRKALTKLGGAITGPVWSADHLHIAFAFAKTTPKPPADEDQVPAIGPSDIWTADANASNVRQVTHFRKGEMACAPAWSPGGGLLAFTLMKNDERGDTSTICLMNRDGTHQRVLAASAAMPRWSPDGKTILFTALTGGKMGVAKQLSLMNADGTHRRVLVGADSMCGDWSPDGRRIAYLARGTAFPGALSLFVANADGSHPVELTRTKDLPCSPHWSADGRRIYFTRVRQPPETEPANGMIPQMRGSIFVIDADGKNQKQLTKPEGIDDLAPGFGLCLALLMA